MWRHFLMVAVVAGCAATPAKVRAASTATYQVDPSTLMKAAMEAVEDSEYEIVDRGNLAFAAAPVNYLAGPNGRDNVLSTAYVVRIVPTGDRYRVLVTTRDYLYGRGLSQDLDRFDGNVDDRINALSVAIYERAKPFATPR